MSKKYIYLTVIFLICIVWILIYTCTTFSRTGFYNRNEWSYTPEPALQEAVALVSSELASASFLEHLAQAAEERCQHHVYYDGSYVQLVYPGGDVPANRGVCSDVVIRSYRALQIDLQVLVHEDMHSHFSAYPNLWRLRKPDKNIDHRRVPNLMTFFSRHGRVLSKRNDPHLYKPGHIVA